MAVRRGKPDSLINDVALCLRLGISHTELMKQPSWWVERVGTYLEFLDEKARLDHDAELRRFREELEAVKDA